MMVEKFGPASTLSLVEVADREPSSDEVVLDVRSIGCNFFDALIIEGKYQLKPPFPFAPGAEVSGLVAKVGANVKHVAVGDRALALLDYGGYATRVVAAGARVFRIPERMSFDEAAAFGIVYQTSHVALHERARLKKGETVLVHAAAGGVGLAAVELAKAHGARVFGTAGSDKKLEVARAHGCEQAWNYSGSQWVEELSAATDGRGVDVVYDPVGGAISHLSMKVMAFDARYLVVGFASGQIPDFAGNRILLKNISIVGVHWGAYWKNDPEVIRNAMTDLFALYEKGQVRPEVSAAYPFTQAAQAIEDLAARRTVGKIVIRV